jgi:hypothetical protein
MMQKKSEVETAAEWGGAIGGAYQRAAQSLYVSIKSIKYKASV